MSTTERRGTDDDEFSFAVWPRDGAESAAKILRALTPTEAAEKRAASDYDGAPAWRGDYRVQNRGTGALYDVTVVVVPQPTFVAIEACDVPMPPATHVLWGGNALCEDLRLRRVPGDWPEGQRWISLKDVADGARAPADGCGACWRRAPELVADLLQIGARR